MRKFIGLMAVVAVAAMALAGIASASSNLANGTSITGTNSGNISLSGIVTCTSSMTNGTLTNNGAGAGATTLITSASYSGCTGPFGSSVTVTPCNLPSPGWDLNTTGSSDGGNTWPGSVTNACVTIGFCTYSGTLTGGNYKNSTGLLTLAGTLSGSCGSGSTSGQYSVSPSLTLS